MEKVMKLLEKESIQWTEEESGSYILIHLDTIDRKRLSFVKKMHWEQLGNKRVEKKSTWILFIENQSIEWTVEENGSYTLIRLDTFDCKND